MGEAWLCLGGVSPPPLQMRGSFLTQEMSPHGGEEVTFRAGLGHSGHPSVIPEERNPLLGRVAGSELKVTLTISTQ